MNEPKRPDPDALLRRIKTEEFDRLRRRGRLKIFLGANAGVGKTYRMLSQARSDQAAEIDIVIGIVETHGRPETEALLAGFEIIPRKKIIYGGIQLEEMDLDAIVKRHPKLVLVDELAHTNVQGSRHAKRYQDIEDLLDAGIDVYTTLNIQHIESLNDVVYQITGVRVRETVPDRILEIARDPDGVELVDLHPNELLQRLKDGKVYIPEKARQAAEKFFRKGNLLALREMSLRYAARLVDQDMRTYMEQHSIEGPWAATSRILACVGKGQLSEEVIRLAKQLSPGIDAEWYAVNVQSLLQTRLSDKEQERLVQNMRLAEALGGKVVTLTGQSIAEEILKFARAHNASLILVGWSPAPRLGRLFRGSLVNTLVRDSGPTHVLVVTGSEEKPKPLEQIRQPGPINWLGLIGAFVAVTATAGLCWLMQSWLQFVNIAMILLLPVVISGIIWGRLAGMTASMLAVLELDFLFVPPRFSFAIADLQYFPSFLVFFCIGITTSFLAHMLRLQGENARQSETFVSTLYSLSRDLLAINDIDELLQHASSTIARAFDCEVQFLLPDGMGNLQVRAKVCPVGSFDQHEWGVASWVFQHGRTAGRGTETLASSKYRYIPLKTARTVVGVLGIRSLRPERFLAPEQLHLLDAFASVVGSALSRNLRIR